MNMKISYSSLGSLEFWLERIWYSHSPKIQKQHICFNDFQLKKTGGIKSKSQLENIYFMRLQIYNIFGGILKRPKLAQKMVLFILLNGLQDWQQIAQQTSF